MPKTPFRYDEDEILDEILRHIESTYGQHYANKDSGIQVFDVYDSIGIATESCQANAIKYLCRYGKKDGSNRKDLLKAAHYVVLMLHYETESDQVKEIRDVFEKHREQLEDELVTKNMNFGTGPQIYGPGHNRQMFDDKSEDIKERVQEAVSQAIDEANAQIKEMDAEARRAAELSGGKHNVA
jgi:hypothetical protein